MRYVDAGGQPMSGFEFCHACTRRIARDKTTARAALHLGINRNADQGGKRVESGRVEGWLNFGVPDFLVSR